MAEIFRECFSCEFQSKVYARSRKPLDRVTSTRRLSPFNNSVAAAALLPSSARRASHTFSECRARTTKMRASVRLPRTGREPTEGGFTEGNLGFPLFVPEKVKLFAKTPKLKLWRF
jgi:hypothetical protein